MPDSSQQKIIGLIAGQGRLPFIVAQGAKKAGVKIACAALLENADARLSDEVDSFKYVPIANLGSWIRCLKKHGVTETIMVGRVSKQRLQSGSIFRLILAYLPDWRVLRTYFIRLRKKDKRNDSVLCAIADELASGGIKLIDSTKYCPDHMADQGVMTKTQPSQAVSKDIDFGWKLVKKMGELDIGQAIVVCDGDIIAVEAIEGTAKMIKRCGELCRKGGWTLIKTAKPNQDMRFDVPCIGEDTVKAVKENGGKCIVVEAGKTIIIDKPQTVELADKLKIAIVGH